MPRILKMICKKASLTRRHPSSSWTNRIDRRSMQASQTLIFDTSPPHFCCWADIATSPGLLPVFPLSPLLPHCECSSCANVSRCFCEWEFWRGRAVVCPFSRQQFAIPSQFDAYPSTCFSNLSLNAQYPQYPASLNNKVFHNISQSMHVVKSLHIVLSGFRNRRKEPLRES